MKDAENEKEVEYNYSFSRKALLMSFRQQKNQLSYYKY